MDGGQDIPVQGTLSPTRPTSYFPSLSEDVQHRKCCGAGVSLRPTLGNLEGQETSAGLAHHGVRGWPMSLG
jgi:hypothetical protein